MHNTMKKTFLTAGLVALAVLFAACSKEDKYLFEKGYKVQADFSPQLELPVSSGQVNFGQLLDKMGDSFSQYLTDDEVITLKYSFDTLSWIDIGNSISTPAPAHKPAIPVKDGQIFTPVEDTVIGFDFPISFFDNIDILSEADISIENLLLQGFAKIWTECPPSVVNDLQFIRADIDNLTINYTKHNGQPGTPIVIPGAELHITDLSDTNNTLPIQQTNLASIFNEMPSYIGVSFHLVLLVDEDGFVSSNISNISSFSELLDSLGMTRMVFRSHIDATLPLELRIGALTYSYDIDLKQQEGENANTSIFDQIDSALNSTLGDGAANIDSSTLAVILRFNNGIPLDIIMNATALDEYDLPIFTLIPHDKIASAETTPIPGYSGVSEASAPVKTEIVAQLNLAQAKQFMKASTLRLKLGLKTTGTDSKSIKRSDYLGIQMLVRVNPAIKIDWTIPGLENGIGGLLHF